MKISAKKVILFEKIRSYKVILFSDYRSLDTLLLQMAPKFLFLRWFVAGSPEQANGL